MVTTSIATNAAWQQWTLKPHPKISGTLDTAILDPKGDKESPLPSLQPLLTSMSTFFKDLDSVSTKTIVLPSVDPVAFTVVLSLLQTAVEGTEFKLERSALGSAKRIHDTITIIDAYDLRLVRPLLLDAVIASCPNDPFWAFAAASAIKDETAARRASLRTLGRDVDKLPSHARELLVRAAPMGLVRLRELHLTRQRAFERFHRLLASEQAMPDINAFIKKCKRSAGCATHVKYGGNWAKLRMEIASLVFSLEDGAEGFDPAASVEPLARGLIKCGKCRERYLAMAERAVRSCEAELRAVI